MEQMKLAQLKEECRKMKLKMTGKRDDLLNRIRKCHFFKRQRRSDKQVVLNSNEMKKYNMKDSEKMVPCEMNPEYYQTLTSFDKHYFLWDTTKNAITKKMSSRTGKIEELTRNDIDYLKMVNLLYEIPVVLRGEATRTRNKIELEEEDDDLYDDICDEEL